MNDTREFLFDGRVFEALHCIYTYFTLLHLSDELHVLDILKVFVTHNNSPINPIRTSVSSFSNFLSTEACLVLHSNHIWATSSISLRSVCLEGNRSCWQYWYFTIIRYIVLLYYTVLLQQSSNPANRFFFLFHATRTEEKHSQKGERIIIWLVAMLL